MIRPLLLLAVMAFAIASAPLAAGQHCDTSLAIYGRSGSASTPPPPFTNFERNTSFSSTGLLDLHKLPPGADQVMVRVNGDLGPGVPTIPVDLDGMGFQDVALNLVRTANPGAAHTYQLVEWLDIPDTEGEQIRATAHYPQKSVSVTYHRSPIRAPPPASPPTV